MRLVIITFTRGCSLHNFKTSISVLRDKFRVEPEDQGVERGETARLVCAPPKGLPTPTVFWKKNGKFVDLEKDDR
jgi:hypothetical protein